MKNNIFYKATIIIGLIIILVLTISLEKVNSEKNKLANENIVGTYIFGNELDDATYLAFMNDGNCIKYKQNQKGTKLKYDKEDSYYTLSNNEIAIIKKNSLLLIKNNEVMTFTKIDETPTMINVLD